MVKGKEKVPSRGETGDLHQQSQKRDLNTESSPERKVKVCLELTTGGTGKLANLVEVVTQQSLTLAHTEVFW